MNPLGLVYPEDGPLLIHFDSDLRDAVTTQLLDNEGAIYARVQSVALQIAGNSGLAIDRINLRNDLIAIFCECSLIPVSAIVENFGLSREEEAMETRNREPMSIFSCLKCRNPLPDGSLTVLRRRVRMLYFLSKVEVGRLIEFQKIQMFLCDVCDQGLRHCLDQERRAQHLVRKTRIQELAQMSLTDYLNTREWNVKRNRALIQAGNRCQLCESTHRLEAHHRTYERLGNELLSDLVVLCRKCHQHYHGILPKAA